jgi:hypothetical protein
MDSPPYPLFLSSQTCDESEPENGKFQWNLDSTIVPRTLKSDIFVQLYNIQMSRQFPNVYNEGTKLTFYFNNLPAVLYTLTISKGYYETVNLIISAINAVASAVRVDTGTTVPNPLTFAYSGNASRILTVDNTNASLDITIEPNGLALRLGICNKELVVPYVLVAPNLTTTLGTWDILFPKQIYVCSNKSLQLDNANDSSLTASRKIIASIPINCNYGDIIPFDRPFVLQPLRNNSIDYIDIEMVDENFSPLSFHNCFALTFMFYKD